MFEQVLDLIKRYDTIIIHRHKNPDGDAMGSQIGLYHLIKDNFPEKTVYVVGDNSERFQFIAGRKMDEIPSSTFKGTLSIVLDTGVPELLCDTSYTLSDKSIRLDHHIFVAKYTDVEIIEPSYESCAGLVAEFAIECGLWVSKAAGAALYTGMVTDSGRFRYDGTTSDTFRRAAFLMKSGFDLAPIYSNLYAFSLDSVKIKAAFAVKIKTTEHNVGYIYNTKEELKELGLSAFDATRGYVNTMADIKGIDIWVAFGEEDDHVLCEIRSSMVNINPIATKYGGGGHQKASGATVANKDVALAMLRDLDELALNNKNGE